MGHKPAGVAVASYSVAEEVTNAVTHGVATLLSRIALVVMVWYAVAPSGDCCKSPLGGYILLSLDTTGSLGSVIAEGLSQQADIELSVLVSRPNRLSAHVNATRFVGALEQGDVLQEAMKGQDAVIFCLAGDLPRMFTQVRQAKEQNGVSQIVAISSIEIYNNPVIGILRPYRALADAV